MNLQTACSLTIAAYWAVGLMLSTKVVPLLEPLGRSPFFMRGCTLLFALAVSLSPFVSFCGLVSEGPARRRFLEVFALSLILFGAVTGLQFAGYCVFTKIYYQMDERQGVLAQLTENARALEKEDARKKSRKVPIKSSAPFWPIGGTAGRRSTIRPRRRTSLATKNSTSKTPITFVFASRSSARRSGNFPSSLPSKEERSSSSFFSAHAGSSTVGEAFLVGKAGAQLRYSTTIAKGD